MRVSINTQKNCYGRLEMRVEPVLLTPEEAARALSVSRATVYDLIKEGALRSVTIGRSRRVPTEAVHEYVSSLAGAEGAGS